MAPRGAPSIPQRRASFGQEGSLSSSEAAEPHFADPGHRSGSGAKKLTLGLHLTQRIVRSVPRSLRVVVGGRLQAPTIPRGACQLISLCLSFPTYEMGMGLAWVREL